MANHTTRTTSKRTRPRRGMALLMVLGVVSTASVLSWAMLSATSMRARLDQNVTDSVESQYLAESGASYAMYYLRYPEKSPVALREGAFDTHYPGQHGISLWSDAKSTVDVDVVNTASGTYLVTSTATVGGTKQTIEAEIVLAQEGYKVTTAASFNGEMKLPTQVSVTGPVSAVSPVKSLLGLVLNLLGGTEVTITTNAAPKVADLSIIKETGIVASTGGNDRTYKIDGVTYVAEMIPTSTTVLTGTLQTSRPTLNPANVWYTNNNVELNGLTLNGTLVLRASDKRLDLSHSGNTNTIKSISPTLPALVVAGDIRQKHQTLKSGKLSVQGVTFVGGKLDVNGTTVAPGTMQFVGSLLFGSTTPVIESTIGNVTVTHASTVSNVKLTAANKITGLSVARWTKVTN